MTALAVASYNVHGCRGLDRRTTPGRIARIIHSLDAGIVALQEVDRQSGAGSGLEQLRQLAAATGMHAIAGPTLLRPDAPCGTALLTRYPVRRVRQMDLSHPGREPRGALDVVLEVGKHLIRVATTHLGLTIAERRVQIRRLLDFLVEAEIESDITILAGDINEWLPWGCSLRLLDRRFGRAPAVPTFPAPYPLLALDRIWAKASHGEAVVAAATLKNDLTRVASDHLPLVARITAAGR